MKIKSQQLYWISTKEVKNPWHDKRCKYGIEKYASFPVGTKLLSWVYTDEISGIEINQIRYELLNGTDIPSYVRKSWSLEEALGLVPYSPTTWERVNCEISASDHAHSAILKGLIESGKISYHAVLVEYKNWYDSLD